VSGVFFPLATILNCHSRERGNPDLALSESWGLDPAFAGMTLLPLRKHHHRPRGGRTAAFQPVEIHAAWGVPALEGHIMRARIHKPTGKRSHFAARGVVEREGDVGWFRKRERDDSIVLQNFNFNATIGCSSFRSLVRCLWFRCAEGMYFDYAIRQPIVDQ
jgi:hypothetical protein